MTERALTSQEERRLQRGRGAQEEEEEEEDKGSVEAPPGRLLARGGEEEGLGWIGRCARHRQVHTHTHTHTHTHAHTHTHTSEGSPRFSQCEPGLSSCVSLFLPFVDLGVERVLPHLCTREKKQDQIFLFSLLKPSGICTVWPLQFILLFESEERISVSDSF